MKDRKNIICMEKVSYTFIQPNNPFLQVYLVRHSKCQEFAGFWKTPVKAGTSKCDFWDLLRTCK